MAVAIEVMHATVGVKQQWIVLIQWFIAVVLMVTDGRCFLNALGAKITGQGSDRITIEGVQRLGGGVYRVFCHAIQSFGKDGVGRDYVDIN